MVFNVLFSSEAGTVLRDGKCFECRREVEGWAGFGISPQSPPSTPVLLKERRNNRRPSRVLSILNKCFVSVPSLLFITNKYLSTESLAPHCFTVIHYFCHLLVLFLSPPLTTTRD